ncbi:MAG TPA: DsbC family protein [Casimicrobiaceae bacterium]|nr:DsbC family protein [Casimicrobiaceae bacterium]
MQLTNGRRARRALHTTLALGLAALAAASPVAFAQAPAKAVAAATPVMTPETAAIRKVLEQKFPGADIRHVARTDYLGLYEVMLDDNLIYTDPKVAYIFVGSVYDTGTKQNLTDARTRRLNRVAVDKLPYELAFTRVKGDGSRKLIIFSDADCPFCHRLETEMKNLDNVTIYTFLFPIDQLHPDAARKSKQIWCAPDKVKAWDAFFASGKLPENKGDCGDPVAKTQALGNSLKINATPTLIFADGTLIPGALPLPQIEKEMANAEAEVKKTAAVPK